MCKKKSIGSYIPLNCLFYGSLSVVAYSRFSCSNGLMPTVLTGSSSLSKSAMFKIFIAAFISLPWYVPQWCQVVLLYTNIIVSNTFTLSVK